MEKKELPVPKWNVWITFIIFVISAIGWGGYIIFNLKNFMYNPGFVLGNTFAAVVLLYLLVLVPCLVMWEYLRK